MDTTLRDGEQTPNVAYTPVEKFQVAKFLLTEVGVDRIEIASTRVSPGEMEGARLITSWASETGLLERVEMLGFCDGEKSVEWLSSTGGRVLNLLTKGSETHCRQQLRLTPEHHRASVAETVRLAHRAGHLVNVYLEDWSNGIAHSPDYVAAMVQMLGDLGVSRIYLSDTLGILNPSLVAEHVARMIEQWPGLQFEFHGHNDYGLATANCLAALAAGVTGVHTSINGLGERAGNASLAEVIVAIHDQMNFRTGVDERRLLAASQLVETFSGKNIAANAPILGQDVFTQTAGVHADGDAKGNLYANRLDPARFGRERQYALGKMSGKASLDQNLRKLGIDLPEDHRKLVLKRITELGDKKHVVGCEDLPLIIADVLKTPATQPLRIEFYRVTVAHGEAPMAEVTIRYDEQTGSARATGAGGYDAFMNALRIVVEGFSISTPDLVDYRVRIPPGGRTEALVETVIIWRFQDEGSESFSTRGVDSDQLAAGIIATEKMLNSIILRTRNGSAPPA